MILVNAVISSKNALHTYTQTIHKEIDELCIDIIVHMLR